MTTQNILPSPSHPSNNIENASSSSGGKVFLITAVALASLTLLVLGLAAQLHPISFLAQIPPIGSGVLLGSGGILLGVDTLYALSLLCGQKRALAPTQELPPVESEDEDDDDDEIRPPPIVQPKQENKPKSVEEKKMARPALGHAMRLFKNYTPALAARYTESSTLSSFLQTCAQHYPTASAAHQSLSQLITIQTELEKEGGNLELIVDLYKTWAQAPSQDSFSFFACLHRGGKVEYVLVQLKQEMGNLPDPETFHTYLKVLQQHHTQKTPLPDNPFLAHFAQEKCYLGALFHQFLGTTETTSLKACKKIYKIGLLREILATYPEWREDAEFRTWVSSSLLSLRKEVAELKVPAELTEEWRQAKGALHILEREWLSLPPLKTVQAIGETHFPVLAVEKFKKSALVNYPGVHAVSGSPQGLAAEETLLQPPSRYPAFATAEDVKLIQQWHAYFFEAYAKGKEAELLESEVARFLLQLPQGKTARPFFESLNEEEKNQVVFLLTEIGKLALTQHAFIGRTGLHPSRYLALLKTLDLLMECVQTVQECCAQEYTLELDGLEAMLGDSYYDLGPYQKEILQTLKEIERKGEPINFSELPHELEGVETLMNLWSFKGKPTANNRLGHKEIGAIQTDFEGKSLPHAIAHLRTLLVLTECFLAPHQRLNHQAKLYQGRENYQEFIDGLRRHMQHGAKEISAKKELLTVSGEMIGDAHKAKLHLKIPNLSVNLVSYYDRTYKKEISKTLGPPVTPYYTLDPIQNGEIRTRLAEGMVANITQPNHVDQHGSFGCEVKDKVRSYVKHPQEGLKQTQLKIHQDKFVFPGSTIEVSRELQQMASGIDNRASNALYTFARNPHLLTQERHGKDFKHLFRLFLFRSTLLIAELEKNPDTAEQVLSNFDHLFSCFENVGDFKSWAFLYKMHADMLSSLRLSSLSTAEREKRHLHYSQKLLGWIDSAEKGDSELFASRGAFHIAFLYSKAVLGMEQGEQLSVAKSLLVAKTQIEQMLLSSPLHGQILYDFSKTFCPLLIDLIEEEAVTLDEILAFRLKNDGKPREWKRLSRGVYQADTLLIDLNTFQISRGNTMEGTLPREIRDEERYKQLFGEKALKEIYTFTYVDTPLGKAWHVSIAQGETTYSLYLRTDDPNFPLVYRHKEGGEAKQLIHIFDETPSLPVDFKKGYLWSDKKSASVEDPKGKTLYTPHFEGDKLAKLERHSGRNRAAVLDPNEDTLFSKLDDHDGFAVTQTATGPLVTYLRGNAQYKWNDGEKKWESTLYKGYFLTNKPIEKWTLPASQRTDRASPFFTAAFTRYHTLENKEGKGKLIFLNRPYGRTLAQPGCAPQETKHLRTLTPLPNTALGWDKRGVIAFDLEPNTPLKSKRPTDYLYLAYLLYIQERYGEALLYVQRSRAVWTATDPKESAQREQIKEWILSWNASSPNAKAFKVKMLLMEQQLRESTFSSTADMLVQDEKLLETLLDHADWSLLSQNQVDPLLRLSQGERTDIELLIPRASRWVRAQLAADTPSLLIDEETKAYYRNGEEKTSEEILQWSLDRSITLLESQIPDPNEAVEVPEEYQPLPLYDVSDWLKPLKESESHRLTQARVEKLTQELREVFEGDSSADLIGQELALDIDRYAQKVEGSFTIDDSQPLEKLEEVLTKHEATLLKEENLYRQRILYQFLPPILSQSESIERKLKDQETLFGHLFEMARHCFGIDDFSPLLEMNVIGHDQLESLKQSIRTYEIARTDRRLTTRKKEAVERLKRDPQNDVLRDECATLLQEWRNYDAENHPYAPFLLLFEDELNITARIPQILHVHNFMDHPNSYFHEAMAAGKTVFLRKMVAAIEDKKRRLAGAVTYAPLMAMHHKDYAEGNNQAIGSTAYPLYYNRNAPHDTTAIKLMIIYHLKALSRHGRIDQTAQSAISLNHTLTELVYLLREEDQKVLDELRPLINSLQKLLRIRGGFLSVYSDEIDKIFDPMKDYNYSVGSAEVLEKKYYQPALALTRLLMLEPSLQKLTEALRKKELPEMDEREFERLLRAVASEAYSYFKLPFDKETTLDYLTEPFVQNITAENQEEKLNRQQELVAFYEKVVLTHPDTEAVLNMQMLHSYIGILLRGMKNKMVGTDFGRSKDGISVKPFSFSAVCQESSQRSFVPATVLEITIDYLVNGIGIEGVKAYVAKVKGQATEEAKETVFEETEAAKTFKRRFNVTLSAVKEGHLEAIAKTLEKNFDLFEECLGEILLKNFTYYPYKIEGNAHHLPHLIGHFAGSSGSPERVKTLPNTIQRHAHLIRQEGSIGSVFYALLKDFDDERDMIPTDPAQPIEKQVASLLSPGDTFVDSKPFFSGKKGLEIVQSISARAPALSSFRLLDEEADTCTWNKEHLRKGEEGTDLTQVVSVIDHKGRQGTNWTFAKGKKGVVGCGVKTELTSYYQSTMRFRLLGKGQRAQTLYDHVLEERWAAVPKLQGKSRLCKVLWTLVKNEDLLLKGLHKTANDKLIRAQATAAIDEIKMTVTDVAALAAIKELPEFNLIKYSPLDPKKCGYPILLDRASNVLQRLAHAEAERLVTLKQKIADLKIDPQYIKHCSEILDRQIALLQDPALIMDARDLPDLTPSNHADQEALEEIEVEAEAQAEQEVEAEQDLSLEVEMELEAQEEVSTEIESTLQKHPVSEEGREWLERSVTVDWSSISKKTHAEELIDEKFFPNTIVTHFALGLYENPRVVPLTNREKQVWVFGRPPKEACIGPKMQVFVNPEGDVFCLLGSIKDNDFYFDQELKKKREADRWIDTPYEEATRGDLSRFGKRQRIDIKSCFREAKEHYKKMRSQRGRDWINVPFKQALMQARQNPSDLGTFPKTQREALEKSLEKFKKAEKTYNHWAKTAEFYKKSYVFNTDLRETTFLPSLPHHSRKALVERIALAKFLYAEAPFNSEEEAFLMEWLDHPPLPLKTLEANLRSYLNRFYPNSIERNHLLRIITRKLKEC